MRSTLIILCALGLSASAFAAEKPNCVRTEAVGQAQQQLLNAYKTDMASFNKTKAAAEKLMNTQIADLNALQQKSILAVPASVNVSGQWLNIIEDDFNAEKIQAHVDFKNATDKAIVVYNAAVKQAQAEYKAAMCLN